MAIGLGLALLAFDQAALLWGGQARPDAVATRVLATLAFIAVRDAALIDVAALLCHPIQIAPGGSALLVVFAYLPRLWTIVLACAAGIELTPRFGIGASRPCLLFAGLGFLLLAEGAVTLVAGALLRLRVADACGLLASFAFDLLGHAL
jgi:hypothetical protein